MRTGPMHYSELAAARRCPQKYVYSYIRDGGLRAKHEALTLKRGLWVHACLQADALKRGLEHGSLLLVPETIDVPGIDRPVIVALHADGGDLLLGEQVNGEFELDAKYPLSWRGMLDLLTYHSDYAFLPDDIIEERYTEGGQDLPTAVRNIIRGYLWQYRDVLPKRRPLLVEVNWKRTLHEHGSTPVDMEGRADLVTIDERGIVCLEDWKSTKALPGQEFKLMESQRWIYLWGLEPLFEELGVKVQALAFDYLVTATPTKPKQNQPKKPKKPTKANPEPEQPTPNELVGELSAAKIKTTPLVYFEALKEYGLEMTDRHREAINELERDNDFYARFVMPVNQKVLITVLRETAQAADVAKVYRNAPGLAYRNVDRSCTFMCDFLPACSAELYGQDAETILARDYEPRKKEEADEGS